MRAIYVCVTVLFVSCVTEDADQIKSTVPEVNTSLGEVVQNMNDVNGIVIHQDEEGVDSVLYYKGGQVAFALDKADFPFQTAFLFDSLALRVPNGWERIYLSEEIEMYSYVRNSADTSVFPASFSVQRVAGTEVDQAVEEAIAVLRQTQEGFQLHNKGVMEINSLKNVRMINFSSTKNGEKFATLTVFFQLNDQFVYWFSASAPNNFDGELAPYMAIYQEVLHSMDVARDKEVG